MIKYLFIFSFALQFYTSNAQNNLYIPPAIEDSIFNLTLIDTTHQFFNTINTNSYGVNGSILAPTLIINKGDSIQFNVTNKINDTTTMHWHGLHVSPKNDGGPHSLILMNETWSPSFKIRDDAATYWYHPHLHRRTNNHVMKGLAGIIIVKDENEANLNLPRTYGVDDFPLILQTKAFDIDSQIILGHNQFDSIKMVNATIDPFLNVPAQIVRFRVLNAGSQRVYNLGLSNGANFHQIASDGGLLNSPVELNRLMLAPGERAELLIDFSNMVGDSVELMSFANEIQKGIYGAKSEGTSPVQIIPGYSSNPLNGNNFEVLKFYIQNETPNSIHSIPTILNNLVPYSESEADRLRHFQLNFGLTNPVNAVMGPFTINDRFFDMSYINDTVLLHDIEVWEIFNHSGIAHPFHIHDVQFYIIERSGTIVPQNELGKKDVVLVKSNETIKFITKFEDFYDDTIPYMYHCHMLMHEDEGMMGQFLVRFQEKDTTSTLSNHNLYIKSEISIYPNPANDLIIIEGLKDVVGSIAFYNLQGKLLQKNSFNDSKTLKLKMGFDYQGPIIVSVTSTKSTFQKLILRNLTH